MYNFIFERTSCSTRKMPNAMHCPGKGAFILHLSREIYFYTSVYMYYKRSLISRYIYDVNEHPYISSENCSRAGKWTVIPCGKLASLLDSGFRYKARTRAFSAERTLIVALSRAFEIRRSSITAIADTSCRRHEISFFRCTN